MANEVRRKTCAALAAPCAEHRIRRTKGRITDRGYDTPGSVHILRHTFCTRLARENTAPTVIQALAENEHLTPTMRYMHVVPGITAEAIRALERPLPTGLAPSEGPEESAGFGRIGAAR